MSSFNDKPISEGTRKKTEYENEQKLRLALNVQRTDGGVLEIPIMVDAKTTEEEEKHQHNTLLAVTPLARLPGYDKVHETPKSALPRAGRIYVFRQNKLWRELETDGKGQLFEVDLAHWRKIAKQGGKADDREPVGVKQHLILLPMFLQGKFVGNQLSMAYSELPWTWEYIDWLEAKSSRIKDRSQDMSCAWPAAAGEQQHWKATQVFPAFPITGQSGGLRARELHAETLLIDPSIFTPELKTVPATELITQLDQRHQELAAHLKLTPPPSPSELPEGTDLLNEYQLRGYPQLVGFILEDPLFAFRHAVAQTRLSVELLQALNALVPHQPFGHYAELLYREAISTSGSLKDLQPYIDQDALKKSTLHTEREQARECLYRQQERMLELVSKKLPAIWNDYLHSKDERLLEPYALLIELLEVLSRSPKKSDPRCIEPEDSKISMAVFKLSRQLLEATHELTKGLLPETNGELPPTAQRLKTLKLDRKNVEPERMGLSSLSLFTDVYIGQNVALAIDEVANHLAQASALVVKAVAESEHVVQADLVRTFGPGFTFANKLHSKAQRFQLIGQGGAIAQDLIVLGAHGGDYSFGLSLAERRTYTADNFLYSNMVNKNGEITGTTSGKIANKNHLAKVSLGHITVVAGPADDPLVQEYLKWRSRTSVLPAADKLSKSVVLPGIATAFAAFSLYANTVGAKSLYESGESMRFGAGLLAASADLVLATNNIAMKLLLESGAIDNPWYTFWEDGRLNLSERYPNWAKNLEARTGNSWLNLSRIGAGTALAATTALFAWDAVRSFRQGENDVAVAYIIASVGSGIWTLYTIGILANPWVLGVGIALFVAGLVGSALLANSAIEQAVKQGPFGTSDRLAHLNDPLVAYQQLLGALGSPRFKVARLQNWLEKASPADRNRLNNEISRSPLKPESLDWAVELQTPLLNHFKSGFNFKVNAKEIRRIRTNTNISPSRIDIQKEKIGAIALDSTRILFIFNKQHEVVPVRDPRRASATYEYCLRIYGQFGLGEEKCGPTDLFPGYQHIQLPQPKPSAWQPYPGPQPTDSDGANDVPYWLIEQTDFAAI